MTATQVGVIDEYIWTPLTVISDEKTHELSVPSPRAGHSMDYSKTGRAYVFGGASHEEGVRNDLFSFEIG